MLHSPVLVPDLIGGDVPYHGSALGKLRDDVAGGLVSGPAGLEGDAASPGVGREADGVGVSDAGVHVLDGYAEHLGKLLRYDRPGAADIDRALDEAHGAVVQHVGDDAGGPVLFRQKPMETPRP